MPLILNIETATTVCSVALARDGKLLSVREVNEGYSHAEKITIFIKEVFEEAKLILSELDAVAVSEGPGSYTGLRIGISTAKGLCYALDKPLIAIETLKAMANGFAAQIHNSQFTIHNSLLCPMIDARRMEVYCAIYDTGLKEIQKTSAAIIDENSFSDLLKEHQIFFFGDGAEKCKQILSHQLNVVFTENIFPSAKNMIALSEEKFLKKEFEDVALFEPFYLKEFLAGKKP